MAKAAQERSKRHCDIEGLVVGMLLVVAVLGGGCAADGSDTDEASRPSERFDVGGLTEADHEYLRQLAIVDEEAFRNEALLVEYLADTALSREEVLLGISEADLPFRFRNMADLAVQLRPGDALRLDHQQYVAFRDDVLARSEPLQGWVDTGNLLSIHEYAIEVAVARAFVSVEVSTAFCGALAAAPPGCPSDDPPAGEYGRALRFELRRLAAQTEARAGFFPVHYDETEASFAVQLVLAEDAEAYRRARDDLQLLEPPGELRTDHRRILQFLVDGAAVLEVTEQTPRTVDDMRSQMEGVAALKSELADGLSPTALAIISPFLSD